MKTNIKLWTQNEPATLWRIVDSSCVFSPKRGEYAPFGVWLSYHYLPVVEKTQLKLPTRRGKYGVEAPATSGNDIFERHYRVQQNTLEQLMVFLPSLWLFARFFSIDVAAGLGVTFIVGRALYAVGYVADPKKRAAGFLIGYLANAALVLGTVGGAIRAML